MSRLNRRRWGLVMGLVLVVVSGLVASHAVWSDHGRDRHGRRYRDHGRKHLAPVNNATYQSRCGACHFTYQPALLPSGSWEKIMARLDNHFGRQVDLDGESRKTIVAYLTANAAEHSPAKRARRIVRCLEGGTPLRITEVPYIRRKHRRLSADVFKRPKIGSLSNCAACHVSAARGVYEDHDVRVPR
jgi:hypothetical protein